MGHKTSITGQKTQEAGQSEAGHSRARTPFSEGMSRLSHGTQDGVTRDTFVAGQGQASTPFRSRPHPTATTDKRFAGWLAGASVEQVERFERERAGRCPALNAGQRELFRLCGQRIVDDHAAGRKIAPEALADGRRWAALPKLPHALSTGEPVPDEQLPPALRGGALEVF